jgi:cytochrome c-type biogenesis protein CcmH/NrfG
MAKRIYQPPQQSIVGQWIDVIVLLALIFIALFLPVWAKIAVPARVEKLPPGVTYEMKTTTDANGAETQVKEWKGLTWGALGQNPVMAQQWQKLGYTVETAADIITQPFDYTIQWKGLIGMIILIGGYYVFLLWHSQKEYKQIIEEKFD